MADEDYRQIVTSLYCRNEKHPKKSRL